MRDTMKEANQLARKFYAQLGYVVPVGFRFDTATHPQEQACWRMAELAYDHIEGTELSEALAEQEEEEEL
ncbi:MAG: hypothetical protein Q7U76_12745 [Nitrospirota bacterium]|nr:hypothetical protein [Nitrospirota bacterium]